jgi:hypothetical protein
MAIIATSAASSSSRGRMLTLCRITRNNPSFKSTRSLIYLASGKERNK